MTETIWDPTQILIEWMAQLPCSLTLIVGMIICFRQRKRRPRVALLLGLAMLAELLMNTVGWRLLRTATQALGHENTFTPAQIDDPGWMMFHVLSILPGTTISALIFGTALWAVLMIDDNSANESRQLDQDRKDPIALDAQQ